MEISLPEIIDRISIIKLKIENAKDNVIKGDLKRELKEFEKALVDFEKKGIIIKEEWLDELHHINKHQWELEENMNAAKNNGPDLKEMGRVYTEIQISNKKRVAIKNRISEETGYGFKDIEIN